MPIDSRSHSLLARLVDEIPSSDMVSVVTIFRDGDRIAKAMIRGGEVIPEPGRYTDIFDQQVLLDAVQRTLDSGAETALLDLDSDVGKITVAIEVIRPKAGLVIFGAGHVGHALSTLGAITGYQVTLVDDREHFLSRDRVPDTRIELIASPFESAGKVKISSNSAVVIVTRGHQHDETCLRETISSPARYIGMIGSKRRVIGVFRRLENSGIDAALLNRVHAPIGLDIGARSPQEIAVAILAEIIQTFNSHLKKNWKQP